MPSCFFPVHSAACASAHCCVCKCTLALKGLIRQEFCLISQNTPLDLPRLQHEDTACAAAAGRAPSRWHPALLKHSSPKRFLTDRHHGTGTGQGPFESRWWQKLHSRDHFHRTLKSSCVEGSQWIFTQSTLNSHLKAFKFLTVVNFLY